MGTLVDNFTGDVEQFYGLVVERINDRGLPEIRLGRRRMLYDARFLGHRDEEISALTVEHPAVGTYVIIACQYGKTFYADATLHIATNTDNMLELFFIHSSIVQTTIERATEEALELLVGKSVADEATVEPEQVFETAASEEAEE